MCTRAICSTILAMTFALSTPPIALAQANTVHMHHDHEAGSDTDPPTQPQDQTIPVPPPPAQGEHSVQQVDPSTYPAPAFPLQPGQPTWYPGYLNTTGGNEYPLKPRRILPKLEPRNQSKTLPLSGYVSKSEQRTVPLPESSLRQQQPANDNRLPGQQDQPQSYLPLQQQAPGCSGYILQPDYTNSAPPPQQPTWYYSYPNQQYTYPDNSRRSIRAPRWNPLTILRGGCF